jgi:thiamine pyrophosphate-dependent acetolactate synthase large subunit-like protein
VGRSDSFTLVIEGDGSFMQAIQELHAAAEQGVRLAVLIMNDSGYGAEVLKLKWKGRDPINASWHSPDFVAIAKSFGGDGLRLSSEADITDAIARAMQSEGPFVIDARISPTEVSDSYGRLFLGQQNRIPLLRSGPVNQV